MSLCCFPAVEPKGHDLLSASPPTCPPLTSQERLQPSKQRKRLCRRHQPPVGEEPEEGSFSALRLLIRSSSLLVYHFNPFNLSLSLSLFPGIALLPLHHIYFLSASVASLKIAI
ncbi:hypothetical protein E2320_014138 [Naja naja]|nr:hypothetical protein E2320_014138 [Naja naja]